MLKKKNLLVFGIPTLILVFVLVYYVLVPGLEIDESPILVQSAYYTVLAKTGRIDLNIESEFMRRVHRATRVRRRDELTPYTFVYKIEHIEVIEKDSRRCQACHGSMRQSRDGEPLFPLHQAMLTAEMLVFNCTDCHKTVDLGVRDPSGPTIRVDRTQCTRCHEGDKDTEPAGLKQAKAGEPDRVQSRYLISNHGIDPKSGKQWIKRHAAVAKEIGIDRCRRCHEKGAELDFCDDCHGGKVPKIKLK